jgi:HEAT repeat protein
MEQQEIEVILSRQVSSGRMTRLEADELHRRLDSLAFNMTVAGQSGEPSKAVAAFWLLHVQTKRLGTRPAAPAADQARAARWWRLGTALGLLRESEEYIAFVDRPTQDYFCLHFCRNHRLDARLLRLIARESLKEIARQWATEDADLVERLTTLLLAAPEAKVRQRAALLLGYVGSSRAVDPLIMTLSDASGGTRVRAAQALAEVGNPRAVEPLISQLMVEHDALRPAIAEAVGQFGAPAVPPLIKLLNSQDRLVVEAAARGLSKTGDPRAVQALIARLQTGKYTTYQIGVSLGAMGAIAVPPLIQALKAPDAQVRAWVATALSYTHDAPRNRAARTDPNRAAGGPGAHPVGQSRER